MGRRNTNRGRRRFVQRKRPGAPRRQYEQLKVTEADSLLGAGAVALLMQQGFPYDDLIAYMSTVLGAADKPEGAIACAMTDPGFQAIYRNAIAAVRGTMPEDLSAVTQKNAQYLVSSHKTRIKAIRFLLRPLRLAIPAMNPVFDFLENDMVTEHILRIGDLITEADKTWLQRRAVAIERAIKRDASLKESMVVRRQRDHAKEVMSFLTPEHQMGIVALPGKASTVQDSVIGIAERVQAVLEETDPDVVAELAASIEDMEAQDPTAGLEAAWASLITGYLNDHIPGAADRIFDGGASFDFGQDLRDEVKRVTNGVDQFKRLSKKLIFPDGNVVELEVYKPAGLTCRAACLGAIRVNPDSEFSELQLNENGEPKLEMAENDSKTVHFEMSNIHSGLSFIGTGFNMNIGNDIFPPLFYANLKYNIYGMASEAVNESGTMLELFEQADDLILDAVDDILKKQNDLAMEASEVEVEADDGNEDAPERRVPQGAFRNYTVRRVLRALKKFKVVRIRSGKHKSLGYKDGPPPGKKDETYTYNHGSLGKVADPAWVEGAALKFGIPPKDLLAALKGEY